MADSNAIPAPVTATTKPARRLPLIWLVPLLALALGGWLAWDTWSKRGPDITVSFVSAEGLQAGQSQLKYKDIVFGTVKSLELTPDNKRVTVTIATTARAERLLTDKTIFWVVKPRLFAGNVSGLETLVSGSYVAMMPSNESAAPRRTFAGHEDPPILTADSPGRTFLLHAKGIGSISLGSPVFFRNLDAGEVLGWQVAPGAESVTIRAFVRAPYDEYVHVETRFWDASGVALKIGAAGVEVQFESLRALVLGGIAFESPAGVAGPVAERDHVFPLHTSHEAAMDASYRNKVLLLAYLKDSVRGLGPGSEVTVHGMQVGHVLGVTLYYDHEKDAIFAPVRFEIDPERIMGPGAAAFPTPELAVTTMVAHGWRVTLQSTNLLTGQQAIALEKLDNPPPAVVTKEGEYFVIPVVESGGFKEIATSATDLMKLVSQIPFKQIGDNLEGILRVTNEAANGPQLKQALTDLASTVKRANDLVGSLDQGAGPFIKDLPRIATDLDKTLSEVSRLAHSVNTGYGDNTKFSHDIDRMLVQLTDTVRSVRSLADLLSRHPEALIKGRPPEGLE